MEKPRDDALANRKTIDSYERCATHYAQSTAPSASTNWQPLVKFMEALPSGGRVIEIGSGPGYDADWLEEHGVAVRRTDAASAFVEFQKGRGAEAEVLDIIEGDIGGPYEGVVAMYVLQHIDRHLLPVVFSKIAQAITENGVFLFSIQEGDGEDLKERSQSDTYYVAKWNKADMTKLYISLGLREEWSAASEDSEGRWITTILIKGAAA